MRFVHITLAIFLLVLSVGMALVLWDAHKLLQNANTDVVNLAATTQRMNDTLTLINHPCAPGPCGPIENLSKLTTRIGDVATVLQVQALHSGQLVDSTTANLNSVALHVNGEVDALHRTTDAATGLTVALTADAQTANRTIAAAQPLFASYTRSGDDLDALLKRKAVTDLLDNLTGITGHGNAIFGDFQQITDKARADYLRPVPWWQQPIKKGADLIDIGAAIARHTP